MILGDYINYLKTIPPETKVPLGLGFPHSWRGDYSQLAFEIVENTTAGQMLKAAEDAVNKTYMGYKGGEFKMTENTKINIDERGVWSDDRQIWGMLLKYMFEFNNKSNEQKL